MSTTVQAAELKGANDPWSRITRFLTALAKKASLANIIDASDGRIIGFVLHHRLVRAAVMKVLGRMLTRFLANDPTNPRAVRAQRVSMGRALLHSIARLFSAAQGKQIISDALLQRVIPGPDENHQGAGRNSQEVSGTVRRESPRVPHHQPYKEL